jgi:hypothetical protein
MGMKSRKGTSVSTRVFHSVGEVEMAYFPKALEAKVSEESSSATSDTGIAADFFEELQKALPPGKREASTNRQMPRGG